MFYQWDICYSLKESFEMLFQKEGDWLVHLKQSGLNEELFINRVILDIDDKSILIKYLKYFE